jgi:hypothetical protein
MNRRTKMGSKPRRLAVLAVTTTLAAGATATAAAQSNAASAAQSQAHRVVVSPEAPAAKPPASAVGLARDLGVDTSFAWRTLDQLARSTPVRS